MRVWLCEGRGYATFQFKPTYGVICRADAWTQIFCVLGFDKQSCGIIFFFMYLFQSLYHIPAFRGEILSYSPSPLPNGTLSHPQCVTFVLELQKIFVLLLKSNRMYIDPWPAIQV